MRYVILCVLTLGGLCGCAAALIEAGAEVGYVATQEDRTTGETIDDQRIVTEVKFRLLHDDEVSGFDINVDSFKRVVTLRGVVKSESERNKAIELARAVSGVVDVTPKLFVAP